MLPGKFYHIYNHANGGENLYIESKNYAYFLEKLGKYIQPLGSIYAYCLLPNHFHLLIKFHSIKDLSNIIEDNPETNETFCSRHISQSFSNLFNSYTKAINKAYNRKGNLFLRKYKSKLINTRSQLISTFLYIHLNPVKHGFTNDINIWPYSSFSLYNNSDYTGIIDLDEGIKLFSTLDLLIAAHKIRFLEIIKSNDLE